MSEHFKLEITNRSTKITTWTGVSPNFAEEYRLNFGNDPKWSDDDDLEPLSDVMRTILFPPPDDNDKSANDKPADDKSADDKSADDKSADDKSAATKNDNKKSNNGKYAKYNYAKRVKQRRSTFKTLAYINFKIPNVQFITLTFDHRIVDYASDLKGCHLAFRKFIKRIRHQYDDFRYLAVFSRQKNKNWHYHMICNFDETVSGKTIHELWSYGIIHNTVITKYDEFDTKISYCIDNMEQVAWEDLQGEKGYLNSKGLQNKIVLRSWNDNEDEMAFEYLRKILGSDDKPIPVGSREIFKYLSAYEINQLKTYKPNEKISDTKSFNINYWVSQKGFAELFDAPVVAKKKK